LITEQASTAMAFQGLAVMAPGMCRKATLHHTPTMWRAGRAILSGDDVACW